MSLLDHAPRLSAADAERLAYELYGLDAQARSLPSERDQNFLLETPGGRFVLKLANAADPRDLIDAQLAALAHLATRVRFCPRVVRTKDDEEIGREPRGHLVRLVTWLPGSPLATVRHHPRQLLDDLGRRVADLDRALAGFDHRALHRDFYWDLAGAVERSRHSLPLLDDDDWRTLVERELDRIERRLLPREPALRTSIVHNDVNDYNVLVELSAGAQSVSGIIDFGDMVHSYTVADPAVAIAYAVLDKPDPVAAAGSVLAGYHRVYPLLEDEIGVVFDLVKLRLCLSSTVAARQQADRPGDTYLGISQQAIRRTLPALIDIHPRFAEASLRNACGLPASPRTARISAWLGGPGRRQIHRHVVGDAPLEAHWLLGLDLSVSSPLVAGDPVQNAEPAMTARIRQALDDAHASIAVGGYLEPRLLYSSPLFESGGDRRTVHLGLDFFVEPGTSVRAALPGVVHAHADNRQPLDYGPVVILRHATDDGDELFTLYGHLSRDSLAPLERGAAVAAGDRIGSVGTPDVNGGWTPHLHFQVIVDLLEMDCDFPGVCRAGETAVWTEVSPDPDLIVQLPATVRRSPPRDSAGPLAARQRHIGPNVTLSYREPLQIARGWMQYLYDASGRRFLDAYNNVPHIGHCHPDVVRAAAEQMRVLNTNTRYLHDALAEYAQALADTFPPPLSVCYFVNSGSEANELALRLARAHTRARDVIVLEGAYHGNTTTMIEISPYKFDGPGGSGKAPWVHVARVPDLYRGAFREDDPDAARKYAGDVADLVDQVRAEGRGICAFIAETCPSVAGQLTLPRGYLERVHSLVRAAGGMCIADEVQTTYGRMGTHFHAFGAHDVIPDIVVLGKPIGNGYPIGAVVTTPEIARSFDTGMEFFSTFGGSTVACAVGLAVLQAVQRERLQAHAATVGDLLIERVSALQRRHDRIGNVRGSGLFLGVELVEDRQTREPATALAAYVVNRLREEGILIGTEGPHQSVLKIRPPMPFTVADAELLVAVLDRCCVSGES